MKIVAKHANMVQTLKVTKERKKCATQSLFQYASSIFKDTICDQYLSSVILVYPVDGHILCIDKFIY